MQKLFSIQEKKFLSQVDKSEKELQKFICDNWKELFQEYIFIKDEFPLKGDARSSGSSGRIDIFAYNPATKRFIVVELKKAFVENIIHQADDYRYYIKKNFPDVYLDAFQKYKAELPDKAAINEDVIEIILIAKNFSTVQIDRAKNAQEYPITLIEYNCFENSLVLFDYVHKAKTGGTVEIKESAPKEWHDIVQSIGSKELREELLAVPYTKDNVKKLKKIIEQVPKPVTRNTSLTTKLDDLLALLKKLD